jgi:hypothetical protein
MYGYFVMLRRKFFKFLGKQFVIFLKKPLDEKLLLMAMAIILIGYSFDITWRYIRRSRRQWDGK